MTLSRKHLDNPVAAGRNHQPAVLAPDHAADSFAAHDAVGGDFLRADALVEGPESDRGVVACRHGFAAVFAKGQGRDGGRVGEHAICALTWWALALCDYPTKRKHTRVGIEEPDELVLVPTYDDALKATATVGAGRAVYPLLFTRSTPRLL